MDKKLKIKYDYLIGIDPGIVCGLAIISKSDGKFFMVKSCKLHELFELLLAVQTSEILVYIENPNTWVPFRKLAPGVAEMRRAGAGAVKQTYKHIIEFLDDNGMEYHSTRLQGNYKKVKADWFRKQTGWNGKTNEHGRDAAMLIFGR